MEDPNLPKDGDGAADEPENPSSQPPAGEPAAPQEEMVPKSRYDASSREALTQRSRADVAEARLKELTSEPTDSDLRAAFPEWDTMTEIEQRSARMAFNADRRTARIEAERELERAGQRWNTDIEIAIEANTALQGREREFKAYANKHKGSAIDVLVSAFLHDQNANPSPKPTPTPRPGLEPGSGGTKTAPKAKKWDADSMLALQKSDPKKYRELLLAGEFDDVE